MFYKICVLKKFANLTGKHLCWSLFFVTPISIEHLWWLLLYYVFFILAPWLSCQLTLTYWSGDQPISKTRKLYLQEFYEHFTGSKTKKNSIQEIKELIHVFLHVCFHCTSGTKPCKVPHKITCVIYISWKVLERLLFFITKIQLLSSFDHLKPFEIAK